MGSNPKRYSQEELRRQQERGFIAKAAAFIFEGYVEGVPEPRENFDKARVYPGPEGVGFVAYAKCGQNGARVELWQLDTGRVELLVFPLIEGDTQTGKFVYEVEEEGDDFDGREARAALENELERIANIPPK